MIPSLKNILTLVKLPKITNNILKKIYIYIFKNDLSLYDEILNKSKISFDEYDLGLFLHYINFIKK